MVRLTKIPSLKNFRNLCNNQLCVYAGEDGKATGAGIEQCLLCNHVSQVLGRKNLRNIA
jgi:hypothetical protein